MSFDDLNVVLLAGGVGGAKMAHGFMQILPPENMTIIGNTGDDFVHLGLTVCPDLDTVMYTLTDLADRERGWGLAGETWRTIGRVGELGGPDWFNLGDMDLATHLTRSHLLHGGMSLTEATAHLCEQVGLKVRLLPMSDVAAPTLIDTPDGVLPFQEWFVKHRWQPKVDGVILPDAARATPQAIKAIHSADIIIIAPSNPYVSVDTILNSYPIRPILTDEKECVIAVSPIIGGQAVKGPAAKMMEEWDIEVSAQSVADFYGDVISGFVYDEQDKDDVDLDELPTLKTNTWMKSDADRARLARDIMTFALEMKAAK